MVTQKIKACVDFSYVGFIGVLFQLEPFKAVVELFDRCAVVPTGFA